VLAERFALGFGGLATLGTLLAVALAGPSILVPFVLAVPLGVTVMISYAQNRARDLWPELAGAIALAVSVVSVALAGGESPGVALALWAILIARNIPSILYVRARLRLERDKPHAVTPVVLANVAALAAGVGLAGTGLAP